ncbi:MAG TPA: endonuclease III, partial [Syntrophorhabdaceae bacterium]|nr:endonuclease III [Syntrophorhabdaceae bacterium]
MFPFKEMVDILKKRLKDDLPSVTRIARQERRDPFLILVGTLLSLRTKDELTEEVMKRLVRRARTPEELLRIPLGELQDLIYPVGFYRNKSKVLISTARTIMETYGGIVPDSIDELLAIKGIGRKTANLVVSEAYGKPGICVDTHVHRISNRIGAVSTKNPHQTEEALRKILPKQYWIIYNTLLVTFGKRICSPLSPRCSQCPIVRLCARKGVTKHR